MEESGNAYVWLGRMTNSAIGNHRAIYKKAFLCIALAVVGIAAVWLASFIPDADWTGTFDPAARAVLQGRSPYVMPYYMNPPWAILPLLPVVLFPPNIARGIVFACSFAALVYAAWRLHAPRMAVIGLLISPTVIGSLLAGNIDSFVVLGIFLPPAWALLVLMIKPQIGLGFAVYCLIDSWRRGRLAAITRTFAPVAIMYALSAILFPIWVGRVLHETTDVWNRSLFPYGIPLGLALLWLAVNRKNKFFALASTPFLSPYLTFYTYLIVQIGLLHEDVEKVIRRDVLHIILCVFLWTIMLVFKL